MNIGNNDHFEVIFVDDHSSDNSCEIIKLWMPQLPHCRLIQLPKNHGPSYARNTGSSAARGDYLIFIDADTLLESNWAEMIMKHIDLGTEKEKSGHNVWGGRIKPLYDPHSVFQRVAAKAIVHKPRFDEFGQPIDFPSGHLMGPKTIFQEIGGFNEFIKVGEDTDLSMRLILKGYKLKYISDIVVYHKVPYNYRQMMRKQFNYGKGFAVNLKKYSKYSIKPLFRSGLLGSLFGHIVLLLASAILLLSAKAKFLIMILVVYILLLIHSGSKRVNIKQHARSIKERLLLLSIFYIRNLSYQLGYLRGYFQ